MAKQGRCHEAAYLLLVTPAEQPRHLRSSFFCCLLWEPAHPSIPSPHGRSQPWALTANAARFPVAMEPLQHICRDFYLVDFFCYFLKKLYLFIFRERERDGERERGKHQCVVSSHTPSTGDLAHNPGICPDWQSNW